MSANKRSVLSSQSGRPKARVNTSLDKNLVAYIAPASAAGVALLAATPPAAAEIVYTPVRARLTGQSTYQIDLNHDGVNDFGLQMFPIFHSSMLIALLDVPGNEIVTVANAGSQAAPLPVGVRIGPRRQFNSRTSNYGGVFMAIAGAYGTLTWFHGPWANAIKKYLGLSSSSMARFIMAGLA
jgi:hypothetical protein